MSPRRLHGWEPREFTEYRYEGGVLVGTVTTREPEFDLEQVSLLLAVRALDGDIGPHGQPMSEALDPRSDFNAKGDWHYEANSRPRIDHAELALELAKESYYKTYPEASKAGHVWSVRKVEG